jgi:hypothetical protein
VERDEYAEKFSELCNFFWYLEHPEWPKDGFSHTSDRCRKLAGEVFDSTAK